jgi:hypothetical protein
MRIGTGYDVHKLVEGRKLIMGGVEIPYEKGLLGHSDADVLVHAIMDALLGAAALGDIGLHFPDTDERYKGADSLMLMREVRRILEEHYFLIETKAPKGFKVADPIEFYLKEDGTIVCVSGGRVAENVLVMIDEKVTTGKKTRTDDDMNAAMWAALVAAAGAGIAVLARKKKKRQN